MESTKKAGIAKCVFGTRETLLLLRAKKGKMLVNSLFFANEIQDPPKVEKIKINSKELDLAKNLINQMSSPFKIDKYKDEYYLKLQKAIKRKIEGRQLVETKNVNEPEKIIDLMEALQKSIKTSSYKGRAS